MSKDEIERMILSKKMIDLYKKALRPPVESPVRVRSEAEFLEVIKGDRLVLADFYADWCAPCRLIAPIVERLGQKYYPKLIVVKVNVGELPELASRYEVLSIPTLIFFWRGRELDRVVGYYPRIARALEQKIKAYLGES